MTNQNLEDGDYSGIAVGLFNSSPKPHFVLQNKESLINLLSAPTRGSFYFAGNSLDLGVNNVEGQTQLDDHDCLDCGNNLYVSGASGASAGNQSDSTIFEVTTGVPLTNEGEDNDQLFVLPWSIITLWCFLYIGISLAAIIGNTLVMWVVAISRTMRTVTNMFIANLALADFIIGLFTIPFNFQAALFQRWDLPDFMCAFCPFVQVLSVNVSVFTLSAIAVDRYRAVLYPLSPRVSKRKAIWAIVGIWTTSIVLALPTHLDYKLSYINDTENDGMKPFCSNAGLSVTQRMYYSLCLLVIQYVFPLIIITGAYARMTAVLWGTAVPGNREESRDAVVLRNKKKVIKMLAVVVILFAVCWLPLQLYNVLQIFFPSINTYKYINIIWFCFHWLAMSNSCCNPFIYAIYNDKFQTEFRRHLFQKRLSHICRRSRKRNNDPEICSDAFDIDRVNLKEFNLKNDLNLEPSHQNAEDNKTDHAITTEFNQSKNRNNDHHHYRNQRRQQRRVANKCKNKTHSRVDDPANRNNNQSYKFDSQDDVQVYADIGNRRNLYMGKATASMEAAKSMRNDSDNTGTVPVETQIALTCPKSKLSRNSSVVRVTTVVAFDRVTQV